MEDEQRWKQLLAPGGLVGGEVEVCSDDGVFRGRIKNAWHAAGQLVVSLEWRAKLVEGIWQIAKNRTYTFAIADATPPSNEGVYCISESRPNRTASFYPPSHSVLLDLGRIEGLGQLAETGVMN